MSNKKPRKRRNKEISFVRSTKLSLKFSNPGKFSSISFVISEYKKVMSEIIDFTWDYPYKELKSYADKSLLSKLSPSVLSARLIQCAAKQAIGIVRGTKKKQEKRQFLLDKLISEGKGYSKTANKIRKNIEKYAASKPTLNRIEMELDSRFVSIEFNDNTCFDGWLTISTLMAKGYEKIELNIPIKKTKHLNKLVDKNGKITNGIRLSETTATLIFDYDKPNNTGDKVIGIDIGVKTLFAVYDGYSSYQSEKNIHGHDLDTINDRLARRKKGSKGFKRAEAHRKNYINQQLNLLNLADVKEVKIEKIRNLRFEKRTSRKLQHFVSTQILNGIKNKVEWSNVCSTEVVPTYTSQRCYGCAWTQKLNRKGKMFKCRNCGHTDDADINSAKNIRLDLPEITREERLLRKNLKGFFWVSKERIVPCVEKVEEEGAQIASSCHNTLTNY